MRQLINIPVPFQTFNDLSDFCDGRRMTEEFADIVGRAISEWIAKQNKAAPVDGDHIFYNGAEVSPAQLVNKLAGCTRNAWKHIWLLLPGETRWQLAETLRT